uniref:Uncharacterized protein n=1 Tax=Graphocephala atropunctata TaxID=36148 RepID=A0A1B6KRV4_9HEMI
MNLNMEASKSLQKLFKFSLHKLLYQTNLSYQTFSGGHNHSSRLLEAHSFSFPREYPSKGKHCILNFKHNHIISANSMAHYTERVLFPNVNPDILFLRNINGSSLMLKKMLLRVNCVKSHSFGTSANHQFWNKLVPFYSQAQVPSKLFAHKAEIEHPVTEGVGWAGQPIVKRVHPILPEVYGDVADIFYPVKELANSTEGYKGHQLSVLSGTSKSGKLEELSADCSRNEATEGIRLKSQKIIHSGSPVVPEEVKNRVRSHDMIPFINEDVKGKLPDGIRTGEMTSEETTNVISKNREIELKQQNILIRGTKKGGIKDRYGNVFLKPEVVFKKSKKKIRKKTKVVSSKTGSSLNGNKKRGAKKKRESKVFRINKKNKQQTQLVLNQRTYMQPFQKDLLFMENRQLKTDSVSRYSAMPAAKQRTSKTESAVKNKGKSSTKSSSSKKVEKGSFDDDCVCPESLEIKGERKSTTICGEAADAKKKLNEWKPKMCLVEKKFKTRRRTFVCASKVSKDKRKKQNLPKCPKPEKKSPPKVVICPPNLEDALAANAKTCEVQEEIKVRKRALVCKPVIIFGKERTEVKVEKVICEKKVKKIKSRHTKICPPPD